MLIKKYTTKDSDRTYFDVLEPLTDRDVTVEIVKPTVDTCQKHVSGGLKIIINDEVAQEILELFNVADKQWKGNWSLSDKVFRTICEYTGNAFYELSEVIDLRGCRKTTTVDKKYEDAVMKIASKLLMEQEKYVKYLIDRFNERLGNKCNISNKRYTERMDSLYTGKCITADWKKNNIDDQDITTQIADYDKKIAEIKQMREGAMARQQEARNRNMYLYLEGIAWGADEDNWDHDPLPPALQEKYTELYKNNGAFVVETVLF